MTILFEPPEWRPAPIACPRCQGKVYAHFTGVQSRISALVCSLCDWEVVFTNIKAALKRHRRAMFDYQLDMKHDIPTCKPSPNPYSFT